VNHRLHGGHDGIRPRLLGQGVEDAERGGQEDQHDADDGQHLDQGERS